IVGKYNDPANLERQLALAEFVIKDRAAQWKDQPVVASAKYALALYYMRQKEPVKSIEYLEDLQKNHKEFRAYVFSQCQLVHLAPNGSAEALKYKEDDPEKALKKAADYRSRALDALRKIPTLPKTADPATAAMFFTAQLNQGTILYNDYVGFIKDGNE